MPLLRVGPAPTGPPPRNSGKRAAWNAVVTGQALLPRGGFNLPDPFLRCARLRGGGTCGTAAAATAAARDGEGRCGGFMRPVLGGGGGGGGGGGRPPHWPRVSSVGPCAKCRRHCTTCRRTRAGREGTESSRRRTGLWLLHPRHAARRARLAEWRRGVAGGSPGFVVRPRTGDTSGTQHAKLSVDRRGRAATRCRAFCRVPDTRTRRCRPKVSKMQQEVSHTRSTDSSAQTRAKQLASESRGS